MLRESGQVVVLSEMTEFLREIHVCFILDSSADFATRVSSACRQNQ